MKKMIGRVQLVQKAVKLKYSTLKNGGRAEMAGWKEMRILQTLMASALASASSITRFLMTKQISLENILQESASLKLYILNSVKTLN